MPPEPTPQPHLAPTPAQPARPPAALAPTAAPAPPNIAIPSPAAQPTPPPTPAPAPIPPIAAQPTPSPTPSHAPPSVAVPTPAAQTALAPPTPLYSPADVAFTQISAGKTHACGLRENGAAVCWKYNQRDSADLNPPDQTAFRQISAGQNFTCALRQDAAIACWGDNSYGQASPPQGEFTEISAGRYHACALPLPHSSRAPQLICWGRQFPNGAETLTLDTPISNIQSGNKRTCGLTPKADMACLSTTGGPLEITPGPFTQISVGIAHICALRQNGSAFCQDNSAPRPANQPPAKFVQIAAGWYHTCAITLANQLECWRSARLEDAGAPIPHPNGEFAALSIGWRNSCALRPNGRAVCWRAPDYLPTNPPAISPLEIAEAFGGAKFSLPIEIFPWPNGGLAIVDSAGIITARYDQPNAPPPQTILDIADSVTYGILSAALDPRFEEFPFLYIWYSAAADDAAEEETPGFVMRLSRFRVDAAAALKNSELVILEIHMSPSSHLGGAVRFGADGMLYLGIGGPKTQANHQALNNLQGKIIRIDIRGANPDQPYRIPPDNPFLDNPEIRPEIWAYGLRNPWRMAFDPHNPDALFVADVGYRSREEVSIATAGANLGYPLCEGDICQESLDPALAAKLLPPAAAYGRDHGCAVIGGVTVTWLDDQFIFGDLCSRRLWLLERDTPPDSAHADTQHTTSPQAWRMRQIADLSPSARKITAFGAGADGSVYVLSSNAPILRLRPSSPDALPNAPDPQ